MFTIVGGRIVWCWQSCVHTWASGSATLYANGTYHLHVWHYSIPNDWAFDMRILISFNLFASICTSARVHAKSLCSSDNTGRWQWWHTNGIRLSGACNQHKLINKLNLNRESSNRTGALNANKSIGRINGMVYGEKVHIIKNVTHLNVHVCICWAGNLTRDFLFSCCCDRY